MNNNNVKRLNDLNETTISRGDLRRLHIVALAENYNAFTDADAKRLLKGELDRRLVAMGYRDGFTGTLPTRGH